MTTLARNKGRWTPLAVAAAVLGFVTWWPIGLAVIAYIMWGGSIDDLARDGIEQAKTALKPATSSSSTTGSTAFDEYRAETLRRLEEEQAEFDDFVAKLREARDREEFERFMADRKTAIEVESTSLKS